MADAKDIRVDTVGKPDDKASSQASNAIRRQSLGSEAEEAELKGRKTMWVMLIVFAVVLTAAIILFVVFLLPEILDMMDDIGDTLRKDKDSFGMVIVCALGATFFNALPLPGRAAWNLIVGYVYGWAGFPIIVFGHCFGAILAFLGARLLWPYLEGCSARRCCCCFWSHDGRPRRPLAFLLACVEQIEEVPMRTVFFLTLSPCPLTLTAYVIGAKCLKVAFWKFFLPVVAASVKLVVPIYIGTKADDLKDLITGNKRDAVDTLFSIVSVVALVAVFSSISVMAYRRLQKGSEEGMPQRPPPSPQRRFAWLGCCGFLILLGITVSIIDFVVLGRLTPLYEPLELEFLSRELCVNLKLTGDPSQPSSMMLEIGEITMDVPLTVFNPNPLDASTTLGGSVFHGNSGKDIGSMTSEGVTLTARDVGWGSNAAKTESLVKIRIIIENATDIGLPIGYPIATILAGMNAAAGGSSPASGANLPACATADPSMSQSTKSSYFQCMLGNCEDSDVVKISGLHVLSCLNMEYLLGCDKDISSQYPQFPQGTLVKNLCGKACNTTGCVPPSSRRLDALEDSNAPARYLQAPQSLDTAVVLEINLKGKASFKVLGKIKPDIELDSTRYLRNRILVDPAAMLANNLAQGSGNKTTQQTMAELLAGKTQCSVQPAATVYCADTLPLLLGNQSDVIQRAGVALCDKLGPKLSAFDEKDEAKWIYSIFFFVVSFLCIVTGTFNICRAGFAPKRESTYTL